MDKVFNVEIDGQITLPDGSKLGPLYETTVKVVQPSDCDVAIENAKETGGFGWTETNPDVVNITWDGDTTGKETVLLDVMEMCLVSNKIPESMLGCNVKLGTGESVIVTDEIVNVFDWGYAIGDIAVVCVFNDNTTVPEFGITFEHKGVYFTKMADEYYTAEVSEPAETIHTIDSKYINGGGGLDLFVVNLLDSEEAESGHTIDKTYEEIANAANENKVIILKYWYDVYTFRTLYVGDDLCFAFTSFYMQDNYAGGFKGTLFVSNEGYLVSPDDIVTEYYKGFSVQADAED